MTERQHLVARVKALAEALEGSEVSELDLSEGGTRIVLRRRLESAIVQEPVERLAPASRPARSRHLRPRGSVGGAPASAPAPDPTAAIVAPLTGVFYSRPSPNSAAFTQVGETVQAGQLACIVEAMKVFNEIKCEISGTVVAILPKDGQLVQKGDALIRVKPA